MPALPWALGAAIGAEISTSDLPSFPSCLVPPLLLVALSGAWLRILRRGSPSDRPGHLSKRFLVRFLLAVALAWAAVVLRSGLWPPANLDGLDPDRPLDLFVRVAGHPVDEGDGLRFPARVLGWRPYGSRAAPAAAGGQGSVPARPTHDLGRSLGGGIRAWIRLPTDSGPDVGLGSRLRLRGYVSRSEPARNFRPVPAAEWQMWVESPRFVEVERPPPAWLRPGLEWRAGIVERLGSPAAADGPGHRSGQQGRALVRALWLGDRSLLPEAWQRTLRATGLAHVLAVSGLHVGLVALALALALGVAELVAVALVSVLAGRRRRLGPGELRIRRRLRAILLLFGIGFYLALVGPRPAAVRASCMAAWLVLGSLARRPPHPLHALASVAACMLLWDPAQVRDLGFRLSVGATWAILALAPGLASAMAWPASAPRSPHLADRGQILAPGRSGPARTLRLSIAVTLCAQAAAQVFLLPLTGRLQPLSVLGNLLVVPWLVACLAVGAVALLPWPALQVPALALVGWLAVPLEALAAAPPGPWARPVSYAAGLVFAPLWLILLLLVARRGRARARDERETDVRGRGARRPGPVDASPSARHALGLSAGLPRRMVVWLVVWLGVWLLPFVPAWPARMAQAALELATPSFARLWAGGFGPPAEASGGVGWGVPELVMLDVGQGDAFLLRHGTEAILLDGGGWRRGDIASRILVPALADLGVEQLRAVIASHGDQDHCGGLVDLLSYWPVDEVWTGPPADAPCLLALASRRGARWRPTVRGDVRTVGPWTFETLWPPPETGAEAAKNETASKAAATRGAGNDDSLVFRVSIGGRTLLFVGDLEAEGEGRLMRAERRRSEIGRRATAGPLPTLRASILKVAHHGSKSSTTRRFLRAVGPSMALISAGRENRYGHPHPSVLDRLERAGVRTIRSDSAGAVRWPLPPLDPAGGYNRAMDSSAPGPDPETSTSDPRRAFDALALVGATATGKSDLAMTLARRLGGEIVNSDAFQVYRGLDIGTAKPSRAMRAEIPHHLVDVADPSEPFSAGELARRARRAIEDISSRGKLPIVVGGSGLYYRALFRGLSPLPRRHPEIRDELERRRESEGLAVLYDELRACDPATAARLEPADRQRIVRALEVFLASGKPLSQWLDLEPESAPVPAFTIGLTVPRAILYDRIAVRVNQMVERGWAAEVEDLTNLGVEPSAPAFKAIGYRQLIRYIHGEIGLAAAIEDIVRATRRYAKRQSTWFRKEPEIRWIPALETDASIPSLLHEIQIRGAFAR